MLALDTATAELAINCVLIGHCSKADCVWTRDEFLTICEHMLNGNAQTEFMLVYRDNEGRAKFAKSKNAKAARRASWSWDTIIGRAKSKVGIGFYPSNKDGNTSWAAMDFDAHDGNALRARGLALAAFEILCRQPQLYVVLSTSGSDGWHLFAFTKDYHPVADWTRMLKQVVAFIGAEVRLGLCEIFPNETKYGSLPYGIRAPGTWNPKTDSVGLIAYSTLSPFLAERKKEKKESPFLYHATNRGKDPQLHDSEESSVYRGSQGEWAEQFRITQPSSRHNQLKALVHHIFRQVGHRIGRLNAKAQYREAHSVPRATLPEHLTEFDELWSWTMQQWLTDLSACEREHFNTLGTENDRDAFRIIRNFARKANVDNTHDFPIPVEHVGTRLGVSYQNVTKIRKRFMELRIIEKTADHIPNVRATYFRWFTRLGVDEPP